MDMAPRGRKLAEREKRKETRGPKVPENLLRH